MNKARVVPRVRNDGSVIYKVIGGDLLFAGDNQLGLDNLELSNYSWEEAINMRDALNSLSLRERKDLYDIRRRARQSAERMKQAFADQQ